jgi:hypothetical protein
MAKRSRASGLKNKTLYPFVNFVNMPHLPPELWVAIIRRICAIHARVQIDNRPGTWSNVLVIGKFLPALEMVLGPLSDSVTLAFLKAAVPDWRKHPMVMRAHVTAKAGGWINMKDILEAMMLMLEFKTNATPLMIKKWVSLGVIEMTDWLTSEKLEIAVKHAISTRDVTMMRYLWAEYHGWRRFTRTHFISRPCLKLSLSEIKSVNCASETDALKALQMFMMFTDRGAERYADDPLKVGFQLGAHIGKVLYRFPALLSHSIMDTILYRHIKTFPDDRNICGKVAQTGGSYYVIPTYAYMSIFQAEKWDVWKRIVTEPRLLHQGALACLLWLGYLKAHDYAQIAKEYAAANPALPLLTHPLLLVFPQSGFPFPQNYEVLVRDFMRQHATWPHSYMQQQHPVAIRMSMRVGRRWNEMMTHVDIAKFLRAPDAAEPDADEPAEKRRRV